MLLYRKKRIYMACPYPGEYHAARETFGAREIHEPFAGVCQKRNWELYLIQGSRPEKTLEVLEEAMGPPDLILDSGGAGALAPGLKKGQVILGNEFSFSGNKTLYFSEGVYGGRADFLNGKILQGRVLTVDKPVCSRTMKGKLSEQADICTMESYFLAAAAMMRGIAFLSLRVITDLADSEAVRDYKKNHRVQCLKLYNLLKMIFDSGEWKGMLTGRMEAGLL